MPSRNLYSPRPWTEGMEEDVEEEGRGGTTDDAGVGRPEGPLERFGAGISDIISNILSKDVYVLCKIEGSAVMGQ